MNFAITAAMYMSVLLGWGVSNVGISLWRQTHKLPLKRYFWQMNGVWGVVNTIVATAALHSIFTNTNWSLDLLYQFGILHSVSIHMVFNIFYIIAGLLLMFMASKKSSQRLRAYAWAVFIQVGFLIVFETLFYMTLSGAMVN